MDDSATSQDFGEVISVYCWRNHCIEVSGIVGLSRSGFQGFYLECLWCGAALGVVIDRASSQLHCIARCPSKVAPRREAFQVIYTGVFQVTKGDQWPDWLCS